MTIVETLASLTLAAAVAVAVAQAAVVSARTRASAERQAAELLAAGNALELLRAAESGSLSSVADSLTGPLPDVPGSRMEIELREGRFGDLAAREFVVRVFPQQDAAPLALVGWRIEPTTEEATDEL